LVLASGALAVLWVLDRRGALVVVEWALRVCARDQPPRVRCGVRCTWRAVHRLGVQ